MQDYSLFTIIYCLPFEMIKFSRLCWIVDNKEERNPLNHLQTVRWQSCCLRFFQKFSATTSDVRRSCMGGPGGIFYQGE